MLQFGEVDKAAHEQVQPAIIVIVEPDRARSPSRCRDSGLCSHVGKRAIAIVAIQNAAPVLGDVKVGKTISVTVAYRNPHPLTSTRDPSLLRNVCKPAIATISAETISLWSS